MKDFSWSYSAYSSALTCLACFKARYLDNLPEPGPTSIDLVFGSAMHSAIDAMLKGEDYLSVFNLYWESYQTANLATGRYGYKELGEMGRKHLTKFAKFQAPRYKLQASEIRLHGKHNGVSLNGQFDFWGTLDGKLSLIDFKTSAYNYDEGKKDVALQLNLYVVLAMQNRYYTPDVIGYQVFNKGTGSVQNPLVWEYDHSKALLMLDEMTDYCKLIETTTKFPRNPNAFRHNYECYTKKESK